MSFSGYKQDKTTVSPFSQHIDIENEPKKKKTNFKNIEEILIHKLRLVSSTDPSCGCGL